MKVRCFGILATALLINWLVSAPPLVLSQEANKKSETTLAETLKRPKLPLVEQLTHATVRIETVDRYGNSHFATGFFFRFLEESDTMHIPAIVTNKHVSKNAVKGSFHMTASAEGGGRSIWEHIKIEFADFEKMWIKHKTADLSILPIAPILQKAKRMGKKLFYKSLSKGLIPTEKQLSVLDTLEEILMIGYPIGLWDKAHNLPIVRIGVTATHPKIDYNGREEFLIDAACFPGSSGSPVFLFDRGIKVKQGMLRFGRPSVKLLGILYAGPMYTADGKVIPVDIPTKMEPHAKTPIPTNLGVVIKAKKLLDFESILREQYKNKQKGQR